MLGRNKRINNRGDDKRLLSESFDKETNLKDNRTYLQRIDNSQSGTTGKIEVFSFYMKVSVI